MNLSSDDFELFGLPPRFEVDRAAVDRRWRALQAEVHPDRHAGQDAAAQRLAMQWSVRVNEAYGRLKDPLKRAAYLCELRGAPIDAERNTAMPAGFLMEQMAWRETLDDAEGPDAVEALVGEVDAYRRSALERLRTTLDDANDAVEAAAQVRALMFVERFAEDLDRRLEALDR